MLKKVILAIFVFGLFITPGIYLIQNLNIVLFKEFGWILITATILGCVTGSIRAKTRKPMEKVERHNIDSFLEHWGTATGILICTYSGFMIRESPGFFSINLHFLGVFVMVLFGTYFITDFFLAKKYNNLLPSYEDIVYGTLKKYLLRSHWQDNGKYLSSQKAAILAFSFIGTGIIMTGLVKSLVTYFPMPSEVLRLSTMMHDLLSGAFVLMFLIHMVLIATVSTHRRLIASWFTGKVSTENLNNEEEPAVIDWGSDYLAESNPFGFINQVADPIFSINEKRYSENN